MSLTFRAVGAKSLQLDNTQWHQEPDGNPPLIHYLDKLHSCSVRRRFARNATIFSEGDAADYIYRIVDGVVRLCKHTDDGRRHVVDFALAGEIFGYVQNDLQTFTAEAVNDAVLIAYPKQRFEQLGRDNADFSGRLLAHLSGNILSMQRQLLLLGCHDAKEKVASFLLRLAKRSAADGTLHLAMGRQDIADHLGLTVETICRTLRDLKVAGAITIPNAHELVLNDSRALRAIALIA